MYFPRLTPQKEGVHTIRQFGGLDYRDSIPEGSFAYMENLSADSFPVTCVRPRRYPVTKSKTLGGMTVREGLCYVDGEDFFLNGMPIPMGLTEGEKQLVAMGIYVIILPDKKYINTLDHRDMGSLEAEYVALDGVTFTPCQADGSDYPALHRGDTPPDAPAGGDFWLDTANRVLKAYDAQAESWVQEVSCYLRLSAPGIGKDFAAGDGVSLSGIRLPEAAHLNGTVILEACEENFVVISGFVPGEYTQPLPQGIIYLRRQMPEMDFVLESGNRLWGCRYGQDATGQTVNEIYASRLGDFKNWNCFRGLSTDSYRVSLGADGPFTGAVNYMGSPLFFRENCLHKLHGSYPAEYRVQTTGCYGVRKDSGKSLAVVEGVLYYLSHYGVCAYDGSLPTPVSQAWGQRRFHGGVGGSHGSKYYISVLDEASKPHLLVLDTARGLWHREDSFRAACFCTWGNRLMACDGAYIYDMLRNDAKADPVKWVAQTGPLYAPDTASRYIHRLSAKLQLVPGSRVRFYARYDGTGDWFPIGTATANHPGILRLPMRTRRCESLELRLEGEGEGKLHALVLTGQEGSDQK